MPVRSVQPAVVIPAYNHGGRIAPVLDGVAALGYHLIVVDDGSTDGTRQVLTDWGTRNPGVPVTILRHETNRGKAAALRTGFGAARRLDGVTHALTIDADGQLDPADIRRLVEAAAQAPQALVLGTRPRVIPNCPARCTLGRRTTSLLVRGQTGLRLADTQCGLRAYPLVLLDTVRCVSARYAFEAEVITRAAWAGFQVVEVPVGCRYDNAGERISHFRPVVDTFRQGAVHARLLLRALAPWPAARRAPVRAERAPARGRWKTLGAWINPARCWREARSSDLGRLEFAAALGLGAWIGTTPFFGLHAALGLYFAWKLHLHPAPTVLGTQVSVPPVGVALGIASVWVGHLLLTGCVPAAESLSLDWGLIPELAWHWFPAWLVGSAVVGLVIGLVVFAIALAIAPRPRSVEPGAA